ncbi:MAG: tripartite tricarboxylate transporter substrate binding protein [Deltaproteobacteria bacterium]|nr:tripartite tricarboxylate transporter substrate binding protein [Deltaproteobacteria bacterium]MBW2307691.1 tripartite tricarboxylate transporter substrate binding protein [Deltaproteobacteria bacterium]
MNRIVKYGFRVFFLGIGFLFPVGAQADFPDRPILYVVCETPGSHVDEMSRRQQPALKDILGAPVVITYRTGGDGSSCWSFLARSHSEGYVVSSMVLPLLILNPLVRKNVGYDPDEFLPLVIYQSIPIGLAVRRDHPAKSFDGFIALARQYPRRIKVGVDARYSPQYLALYQFQKRAGIELTTVIFAGPAKQMAGFRSKEVEAVMARSTDLVARATDFRILAIGTQERLDIFPTVPTFVEKGIEIFPRIDLGVCIRKGVPQERVRVLERAFLQIAQQNILDNELRKKGFIPLAIGSSQSLILMEEMKKEFKQLIAEIDISQGWSYEIKE